MTAGFSEWMLQTARDRRATHTGQAGREVEAGMVSAMTAGPGNATTRDATLAQSRDYVLGSTLLHDAPTVAPGLAVV